MHRRRIRTSANRPIPLGQDWFLDKLFALITFESEKEKEGFSAGFCFGISMMWLQAFLVKDLDTFNRRMQIIHNFQTPEEMVAAIERVREKKIAVSKKLLAADQITPEEELIFSIPNFFDGLLLHQKLSRHKYLFPASVTDVPAQHAMVSAQLAQSIKLEKMDVVEEKLGEKQNRARKQGVSLFIPEITSPFETMKKEYSYSFTGLYSKPELEMYFDSLKEVLSDPPIDYPMAIRLGGEGHSIIIGYDPETRNWLFTDPNQMPTKDVPATKTIGTTKGLVDWIQSAVTFCSSDGKKMSSFTSSVFMTGNNYDALNERMQKWMAGETWQKIHKPTEEKANYNYRDKIDWLEVAIRKHDAKRAVELFNLVPADDKKRLVNAFIHAAREGLLPVVEAALERKISPLITDRKKDSPLFAAVEQGHLDILKLFVKKGFDLNVQDEHHDTILFVAAENGHTDMVKYILDNQIIDDIRYSEIIEAAIEGGHAATLDAILDYQLNHAEADSSKEDDEEEKEEEEEEEEEASLSSSSSSSSKSGSGSSKSKSSSSSSDSVSWSSDDDSEDEDESRIRLAARVSNPAVMQVLIKYLGKDFDINKPFESDNNTLLHEAAMRGNVDVVKFLLARGANPAAVNDDSKTPAQLANKNNHDEVLALLPPVPEAERKQPVQKKPSFFSPPTIEIKSLSNEEVLKMKEFEYQTLNVLIKELNNLRLEKMKTARKLSPTQLERYNALHKKLDGNDPNPERSKTRYREMLFAIKFALLGKTQTSISGPMGEKLLLMECQKACKEKLNTDLSTIPGRIDVTGRFFLSDKGYRQALDEMQKTIREELSVTVAQKPSPPSPST